MKGPFVIALAAGLLSLLIAFAPALWRMAVPPPPGSAPAPVHGAPWQVALPAPGHSRVFGLDLPTSTLAQVQARWGDELTLALIVGGPGRSGGAGAEARWRWRPTSRSSTPAASAAACCWPSMPMPPRPRCCAGARLCPACPRLRAAAGMC